MSGFDDEKVVITKTICFWYDLLGYGAPFKAAKWDLSNPICHSNIERIRRMGSWMWGQLSLIYGPKLILNDGVAACLDITEDDEDKVYSALCYFEAMIQDYITLNHIDERDGNPGIRGVISCGDRFEYDSNNMTVTHDPKERVTFYHPVEFQMNTAFSKAFIMEESGKKAGLIGPNLYFDKCVFILLNDVLSRYEGKVIIEEKDDLIETVISFKDSWFATIYFDKKLVLYNKEGIDTDLFCFRKVESIIEEYDKLATLQQSQRFQKMEEMAEESEDW